jgi:hypothetical protein
VGADSSTEGTVYPDGNQGASDDGNRVDVGDLPVGIEDRHQEQTGEPANECGGDDLQRHQHRTAGTPMVVV